MDANTPNTATTPAPRVEPESLALDDLNALQQQADQARARFEHLAEKHGDAVQAVIIDSARILTDDAEAHPVAATAYAAARCAILERLLRQAQGDAHHAG